MDASCRYIKTHLGAEEGYPVLESSRLQLPIALF